MAVTPDYHERHFFVRLDGHWLATPLVPVFIVIGTTDIIFAVDSIPAVFAITTDPFIVYTSNVFAILGLRALYFLLAGVMGMFRYLRLGVCVVLVFVGVKMLVSKTSLAIPTDFSTGVIVGVLALSVLASIVIGRVTERRTAREARKAGGSRDGE
jgi:tellurite resistance protein TerC